MNFLHNSFWPWVFYERNDLEKYKERVMDMGELNKGKRKNKREGREGSNPYHSTPMKEITKEIGKIISYYSCG